MPKPYIVYDEAWWQENHFSRPNMRLGGYLRRHPELRSKLFRFDPATGGKGRALYHTRHNLIDLFGERSSCYWVHDTMKARQMLVQHLVDTFKTLNPNADSQRRRALTTVLHQYNLHWGGCDSSLCRQFWRDSAQ